MAATRYRRFLKLCEEWPKDESKKGRDLGTFLRQKVASVFREGENTQVMSDRKIFWIITVINVVFKYLSVSDYSAGGIQVLTTTYLLK